MERTISIRGKKGVVLKRLDDDTYQYVNEVLKCFHLCFAKTAYLVGSRGCLNNLIDQTSKHTDFDFVADFLNQNNFQNGLSNFIYNINKLGSADGKYKGIFVDEKSKNVYFDSQTEHIISVHFYGMPKIDFVFKKNVEFYVDCLEMLTPNCYEKYFWKSSVNFLPPDVYDLNSRRNIICERFEDLYEITRKLKYGN